MYASWLRPFLILGSANHLESAKSPDLIDAFNTTLFRVELLASNGDLLEAELADGTLPSWLGADRFRRALPVLVVEVLLRTVPTQARGGGFHHRGCIDITLTSYALREDELGVLQAEREQADLRQMIQALGVMDQRILGRLEAELNRLNMVEGTGIQPGKDDTNPFAVLWTAVKSLIRWRDPVRPTGLSSSDARLTPDSVPEQVLRSRALILARQACAEAFFELKAQLPRPAWERRALS